MAPRIGNIAFDCDDVLKVAAFWPAALGRPVAAPGLACTITGDARAGRRQLGWLSTSPDAMALTS